MHANPILPIRQPAPKPAAQAGHVASDRILVDAAEAAKLLSISARTLWSLTQPRGPIAVKRIGRAVRYPVSALRLFAESGENGAAKG